MAGVGLADHSSGGLEAEGLATVEKEEGVALVVHKQLVIRGETCLRIPPPPAVLTTAGIRGTSPSDWEPAASAWD